MLNKNFLVCIKRKVLNEKGAENYKPPATSSLDITQRQASPTRQIKNLDTLKSTATSTTSGGVGDGSTKLRNTSSHSMIQRPELALYDTREIDFDEVNRININNEEEGGAGDGDEYDEEDKEDYGAGRNEDEEDDESASWNHHTNAKRPRADDAEQEVEEVEDEEEDGEESSGDSGGFRKPVDFGIDKETSAKLDKLNVMLMVGGGAKETTTTPANQLVATSTPANPPGAIGNTAAQPESAPTSSREPLDSPTRLHVKNILGQKYG